MEQKELLQKQAREELFKAQKKFKEEKRIYNEAVRNYYKTINIIEANYPNGNYNLETQIKTMLEIYNISDFEIKKYEDTKIFNYINSNFKRLYHISDYTEKNINKLNPDNLLKLSAVLSANKNNYLIGTIVKNIIKPDYINKIIKPIIKDTYGAIVFEEQAIEIINLILNADEYEIDIFYESLKDLYMLQNVCINSSTYIIDFIRKNYCKIYIEQYKMPYFAFIASAIEKGIKENKAQKLFNLLLAYFISPRRNYKNEKILHAKELYKLAFIELNHQTN